MADSDSFINEVTEEVRRDRLFAFFRRWGWAFGLAVLVIVGIAAFSEFRRAQTTAAAQEFGDAVIGALEAEEPADRITALEAITPDGAGAEMLLALLIAGQESENGDTEGAATRLRAIAERGDMPDRYRDLALLKAHMLAPGDRAEANAMLDRLARPGAPYRALAIEQQAYLVIEDGDIEGGTALLEELLIEASAAPGLQQRVRQVIVALQSGAVLSDAPLPEPDLELELDTLPDFPVGEGLALPDLAPDTDASAEDAPSEDADGGETGEDDTGEDDTGAPAPSE